MAYNVYQAGMPSIYSGGARQRGSGFLSALKRFVLPLAKRVIPHVAGVVSDIAQGGDIKDTLKKRGMEAGADVLETAAGQGAQAIRNLSTNNTSSNSNRKRTKKMKSARGPPSKKYKSKKKLTKRHKSWK